MTSNGQNCHSEDFGTRAARYLPEGASDDTVDTFVALRNVFNESSDEAARLDMAVILRGLHDELQADGQGCYDYSSWDIYPCPDCERSGWSYPALEVTNPASWARLGLEGYEPKSDVELEALDAAN